MAKEKIFENKVKSFITSEEGWFIKYWAGSSFTKTGIPDILACINGRFYGIEVKAENGKPSLLQLINLRKIRDAGGIALLLYPQDLYHGFWNLVHEDVFGDKWYAYNIKLQEEWFKKLNS